MSRWISRLFAVYFTAVMAVPGLLFIQFEVRRSYIERELCVQRDVMESMRTCHGECVLSKRYKALEHEAEKGFPVERMVRYEPVMEPVQERAVPMLPMTELAWAEPDAWTAAGFWGTIDHVPKG